MIAEHVPREKLSWMYEKMVEIRKFEEAVIDLYNQGLISETCHLSIGQEAISAAVGAALEGGDYVLSPHRAHAQSIVRDVPLFKLIAEILGRIDGCNMGRGGTMRLSYPERGILYSCSLVGSNIPIAAGVGLSVKLRGLNRVVTCFFGDGASNTGSFHEGMNLASLWKLPVVFVCENNQYAISTPFGKSTSVKDISDRARSYSVPGVTVDGNDVLAVYDAASRAVERARNNAGPSLIECKTYRLLGHYTGDPESGLYRAKEEVEEWKGRCPIMKFKSKSLEMGFSEKDLAQIDDRVAVRIKEAVARALKSPFPTADQLLTHV
jgi:TPP-dependent pyruvate/acetoin dehydrogenase alpha subunit